MFSKVDDNALYGKALENAVALAFPFRGRWLAAGQTEEVVTLQSKPLPLCIILFVCIFPPSVL